MARDCFFQEYKYTEFPIGGVKRTTCKPTLEWSMNPKFCTSYLSRKDCLEENADFVQKILNAEVKTASTSDDVVLKQPPKYVREASFLDPIVASESAYEKVQVMQDDDVIKPEEAVVEEEPEQKEKKKKKKKGKKKSKDSGETSEKPKKDKKNKRKKDKKENNDDIAENEMDQSVSKSSRKSKRKRSDEEPKDGEETQVEGEVTTGQKKKRGVVVQLTEGAHTKKEKKKKRKKQEKEGGEDASPLQDEHTPLADPVEEIVQG